MRENVRENRMFIATNKESIEKINKLDAEQEERIQRYCDTDEPYDKAGAYGIQGQFAIYVRGIKGDYDNVVGLPSKRVGDILKDIINS